MVFAGLGLSLVTFKLIKSTLMSSEQTSKNIIICLDGTGNQFGDNLSNVVKLYRMLFKSVSGKQITYYDPGVGTMGDPTYKTLVGREINKVMGKAFGRGLMKNVIEAYTFLMEHYEDGDKVFIFGFSRGAYTARALAAFIKDIGLLEKGANNLVPYAMKLFLEEVPKDDENSKFYKKLSKFRSTYGRLFYREPDQKMKKRPNYQLPIHCMGLFDTVKSYGWINNPVKLRNEVENPSVRHLRHAISINERRVFFPQMHWKASAKGSQNCKEVWFAGDHSDVGGGYQESESGLAKITLEWMVHEAMELGIMVDPERYGYALQKEGDGLGNWIPRPVNAKYSHPDPTAIAHESLTGAWKLIQLLKPNKGMRKIKSGQEREATENAELNPILVHQSVLDRINGGIGYDPKNLLKRDNIEHTISLNSTKTSLPAPPHQKEDITFLTNNELKEFEAYAYPYEAEEAPEPQPSPKWKLHQDAFVFSCYVGGLRFSDLCRLKWSEFDGTHILCSTIKADSVVSIKVPQKGLNILNKYKTKDPAPEGLIFPILDRSTDDTNLLQNKIILKHIYANKDITIIADKIRRVFDKARIKSQKEEDRQSKLTTQKKNISFHTSCHTWASKALREEKKSIEDVSDITGLSNETIQANADTYDEIYAKMTKKGLDITMNLFHKLKS
jgi:uncharacterized protein (DUF2235 family)